MAKATVDNVAHLCGSQDHMGTRFTCTLPKGHDGLHAASGLWWRQADEKPTRAVTRLDAYLKRITGKDYTEEMLKLLEANPNYGYTPKHPQWQNIIPDMPKVGEVVGYTKGSAFDPAYREALCGVNGCVLPKGHGKSGTTKSHFRPGRGYWEESGVTEKNYTLLQGLLRSGVTVAEVIEQYKLRVSRSKRHSNLVQFKYDQIESDLSDTLVQQCRGIIMDEADNWRIVARPFDKFFNYGEVNAAKIDWDTARVVEKLDGSCVIMYWYQGWHVATLGSCDASGPVHGFPNLTFAELFWDTFQAKKYKVPDAAWQDVTFIFELTSPFNRVVVPHAFADLHLLGARVASGDESSILGAMDGKSHGYKTPKVHSLKTPVGIEESMTSFDPLNFEGYVVVDAKYNRVKMKHPGYVRLHHLKDSFTLRNVVEMVRRGETPEFLAYFPEHKAIIEMVRNAYLDLVDRIVMIYVATRDIEDNKTFAMTTTSEGTPLKDLPFSGILFALKRNKAENVMEALKRVNVDNLIEWLEVERPVSEAKAS